MAPIGNGATHTASFTASGAASINTGSGSRSPGRLLEVLARHDGLDVHQLHLGLASAQGRHARGRQQISTTTLLERFDHHSELRIRQDTGVRGQRRYIFASADLIADGARQQIISSRSGDGSRSWNILAAANAGPRPREKPGRIRP